MTNDERDTLIEGLSEKGQEELKYEWEYLILCFEKKVKPSVKGRDEWAKEDAIKALRILLKPGATVWTVTRHVSASGMQRSISCVIPTRREVYKKVTMSVTKIDYFVSRALGWKIDRTNGGIKVGGCGMDMGFHLVYSLSRLLFPDGTGDTKRDGGYALKQEWL